MEVINAHDYLENDLTDLNLDPSNIPDSIFPLKTSSKLVHNFNSHLPLLSPFWIVGSVELREAVIRQT